MRARSLVALLVVAAVFTLTPLAKASPVDPWWVAGFWDDGDYDDVILLICGTAADLPTRPAPPRLTREVVAHVELLEPAKPALAAVASALSRAPPSA